MSVEPDPSARAVMSPVDVDRGPVEMQLTPADSAGGATPPLVFLHEGLGSLGLWRSFPDQVRQSVGGPASLVYSRHGYGRSAVVDEPREVDYMHHEAHVVLPELLERLGLERPLLVGHSDGASIALLHAGAGHPVAAMVLIAPHVFVEDRSIAGITAARDVYETTDLRDRLARHHHDIDATFRGWNDIWLSPEFRTWNIKSYLPNVTCPVLLIQGDADEYGTLAQLDAIEAAVRGPSRRLVVPGAGHAPHSEAPDAVLPAITDFIHAVTDR